jgi:hypothetical protein
MKRDIEKRRVEYKDIIKRNKESMWVSRKY